MEYLSCFPLDNVLSSFREERLAFFDQRSPEQVQDSRESPKEDINPTAQTQNRLEKVQNTLQGISPERLKAINEKQEYQKAVTLVQSGLSPEMIDKGWNDFKFVVNGNKLNLPVRFTDRMKQYLETDLTKLSPGEKTAFQRDGLTEILMNADLEKSKIISDHKDNGKKFWTLSRAYVVDGMRGLSHQEVFLKDTLGFEKFRLRQDRVDRAKSRLVTMQKQPHTVMAFYNKIMKEQFLPLYDESISKDPKKILRALHTIVVNGGLHEDDREKCALAIVDWPEQ